MKIICISCGHSLSLDEAYDDFAGMVKCYVCDTLLEVKTCEGKLQCVNFGVLPQRPSSSPQPEQTTSM